MSVPDPLLLKGHLMDAQTRKSFKFGDDGFQGPTLALPGT